MASATLAPSVTVSTPLRAGGEAHLPGEHFHVCCYPRREEHPRNGSCRKKPTYKRLGACGGKAPRTRCCLDAGYTRIENENQILSFVSENASRAKVSSSALALAAAMKAVVSNDIEVKKKEDLGKNQYASLPLISNSSEEFVALCENQLQLCSQALGQDDRITVYIRTPDSYTTGLLDFRLVTVYPSSYYEDSIADEIITLDYTERTSFYPHHHLEKLVASNEVLEFPDKKTIVFSLSKDSFLMGLIIIERLSNNAANDLNTYDDNITLFSKLEQEAVLKFIESIKLACLIDQRAILLHQSSLQSNIHMNSLIEKMSDPLTAFRTLGRMLKPQLNGELSDDIMENMFTQGDKLKETLQQMKKTVSQSNLKASKFVKSQSKGSDSNKLPVQSPKPGSETRLSSKFLLPSEKSDFDREIPMPPLALPLIDADEESCLCNAVSILESLISAGQPLAADRSIDFRLLTVAQESIPLVHGGASKVKNIFSILMDVSLHSVPPHGWIRVEAMNAPGGGTLIIIENNASGMEFMMRNSESPESSESLNANEYIHSSKEGMDLPSSSGDDLSSLPSLMDPNSHPWDELLHARDLLEDIGGVLRVTAISQDEENTAFVGGLRGTRMEVWFPPSKIQPQQQQQQRNPDGSSRVEPADFVFHG